MCVNNEILYTFAYEKYTLGSRFIEHEFSNKLQVLVEKQEEAIKTFNSLEDRCVNNDIEVTTLKVRSISNYHHNHF